MMTTPAPRAAPEAQGQDAPGAPLDATFAASFPQLSFQFVNYGSSTAGIANVVYVARNTTANRVDLQLSINTGSSALVPGPVVAPEQLPPTGSQTLLYLDLSALQLTPAAWNLLKPAADGWNCVAYAADQVVGMSPSSPVTLKAGASIAIHLTGLELDQAPPSPAQLSVTYFNVPGITTGGTSWASHFAVAVQNPPVGKDDLTKVLAVSLASPMVVNSYQARHPVLNTLTLDFSRTPAGIGVPAGPDTLFTVSFVYAPTGSDGYGALTDAASAQNIKPVKGNNVDAWIGTSDTGAQEPRWTLQPPAGADIAGTGVQAVSSWSFTPVVTAFQPGPTVMLVQYTGVPGYADGVFSLVINKIPHVVVRSLSVSPSPAHLQNGQADVTVSWETSYATSLKLTQNFAPSDVTGLTSTPATLTAQSTSFSLQATGPGGDVDNVDMAFTTAVALPVINSFAGAPTEIYSGSASHDVNLYWAVDTTGKVELTSSTGQVSGGGFNATDHTSSTVTQPQMITMAPVTDPGVAGPSRNLVISAFTPAAASHAAGAATSAAAVSPSAPFLALASPAANQVIAVDTVQFSPITTVAVGKSPGAVAFSPDGSLMVTLNGDATVSLHGVSVTGGTPVFTPQGTVTLSGSGQAAVVTPDLSRIYVSVDGAPGSLVALVKGASGYAAGPQVAVGKAPRGVAADPSGARLYVANSGDDSVSVVGIGIDGSLKVVSTAQGFTSQPTGVAVTAQGSTQGATLLVACRGSNQVWAADANNPGTGNRQQLSVGAAPVGVAVTPGGAYAFVANSGDGTVSLLDVWSGPPSCAVLQTIKVGTSPSGVAVGSDGLTVLVPDSGAQSFGVVTLQIYSLSATAEVGSAPTDVVVTGDGTAALVWHNAMLSGQSSPGAMYYPVSSGVPTQILGDVPLVQCVFAPPPAGASHSLAYAVGSMEPMLYVLDLSDPQNPGETDVPLPVKGHTRGLAVTPDGSTVFVVMVDGARNNTLLAGSAVGGSWTPGQSLSLYNGAFPGAVRMAVSPDGSTVFIADPANRTFSVAVRGAGGQYALSTAAPAIPTAVGVTVLPDGSSAYVLGAGTPNTITVVDVASLTARQVSLLQPYVNLQQELVAAPDGRRLYAADLSAGALRVLDAASLRILQTIPLAQPGSQAQGAAGAAISPDASRIFVAVGRSGTLAVLQQIRM